MKYGISKRMILWILSTILLASGCGSADKSMEAAAPAEVVSTGSYEGKGEIYDYAYEEAVVEEASVEEAGAGGGNTANVQMTESRKLIKQMYMTVETEEFDTLIPWVEAQTAALGGYLGSTNIHNGSSYRGSGTKTAEMTIRIPKDRLNEFVSEVSELSNVIYREEQVEDVTLQYVDLESHKKVLKVEQQRLVELLEQAESMEEIILLEERLSEVRYELERMESQLRTYDNLIEYSTLYLSVEEVERLTPVQEQSILEKMGTGFMESFKDLGRFLIDFGVGFVIFLPYLAFLAVCITGAVLFLRLVLGKRKKRQRDRGQAVHAGEKEQEVQEPIQEMEEKEK